MRNTDPTICQTTTAIHELPNGNKLVDATGICTDGVDVFVSTPSVKQILIFKAHGDLGLDYVGKIETDIAVKPLYPVPGGDYTGVTCLGVYALFDTDGAQKTRLTDGCGPACVDPDTGVVHVACGHNGIEVLDYNCSIGQHRVELNQNGNVLFVCHGDKDEILYYDEYADTINSFSGVLYDFDGGTYVNGVAYDRALQRLYVSNFSERCVDVLERDIEGNFFYSFSLGQEDFVKPGQLCVLDSGSIVVIDEAYPTALKVFKPEGATG